MRILITTVMLTIAATVAIAAEGDRDEVLGIKARQNALQVIEERCVACHNRQRIEKAASEKQNLEALLQRMEKKGAVVTAKEREVIGHFWGQNPLKTKQ